MLKPALASAILALAVPLPAQTVPSTLPVEGRLTLQGEAVRSTESQPVSPGEGAFMG